jgi:uncharacterized membrane protein YfcA
VQVVAALSAQLAGKTPENRDSRVGIYLPIAEMSVNAFVLLAMGAAVGFLSGMFGVGGGFLITPLLIFYNIPPAIAVATGANQVIASSFSGMLSHMKRGTLDFKLGTVLLVGGHCRLNGRRLRLCAFAQRRTARSLHFIALRRPARHRWRHDAGRKRQRHPRRPRRRPRTAAEAFGPTQLDPSPAIEDALSHFEAFCQRHTCSRPCAAIGFLASIMGVGGGFIMVPALIYLLKVPTNVVVGTSLFHIVCTAAYTTIVHATANHSVDVVLALLLMIGGRRRGAIRGQNRLETTWRAVARAAGAARPGRGFAPCL